MVSIKHIFLFVSTTVAFTASNILEDVSSLDTNIKALTSALNSYDGGFFGAISVVSSLSKLEDSIKKATSDCTSDSEADLSFSSTDSKSVVSALHDLTPDIQECLTTAASKKAEFDKLHGSSAAKGYLQNLQSDMDVFAEAIIALLSPDHKSQAVLIKETIDGIFEKAIDSFGRESTSVVEGWQDILELVEVLEL